jgi:hypothetical protein
MGQCSDKGALNNLFWQQVGVVVTSGMAEKRSSSCWIQSQLWICCVVSDIILKCLSLRVIHYGSKISTECPNHVTMNCPNFIKNLNYFSTINVKFSINSSLSLKEFSIIFRFFSSSGQEYTRNNWVGLSIFPGSYCYFLRYLCHLRLGNIQAGL